MSPRPILGTFYFMYVHRPLSPSSHDPLRNLRRSVLTALSILDYVFVVLDARLITSMVSLTLTCISADCDTLY